MPEKCQQLRLDKTDPRATHGVYIRNVKGTNSWKQLTLARSTRSVHGRRGSDRRENAHRFANAPAAHLEELAGVGALASDGSSIFEGAELVGKQLNDASGAGAGAGGDTQRYDRADGVVRPAPPLALLDRPLRDKAPIARFEPGAQAPRATGKQVTSQSRCLRR